MPSVLRVSDPNTFSSTLWQQDVRYKTKIITVEVLGHDTIANVKSYIEAKVGIPAAHQCLKIVKSFGVLTLTDDRTLADYNLKDGRLKIWLNVTAC